MRQQAVLLLLVITACCWVRQCAASTLIRGASPDNTAKYTPEDGKFTCFDGSLTIDFSQVRGGGRSVVAASRFYYLQPSSA